jgi:hypothetical protein
VPLVVRFRHPTDNPGPNVKWIFSVPNIRLHNRELMAFARPYDQQPATAITYLAGNRIIEVAMFEALNNEIFDKLES